MLYSSREIAKLLSEAVEDNKLDTDALRIILYYLHLSNEEIPLIIAEKIIDEPELIFNQEILGQRLAYTHVHELSEIRHNELRYAKQLKISRQLNRIALYLEEHKAPTQILFVFTKLTHTFLSTLLFFESRKQKENTVFAAEEVLVLEQLIESILLSKDLAFRFFENLFCKLGNNDGKDLAYSLLMRLQKTATSTLSTFNETQIINPNTCIQFNKSLESEYGFNNAVDTLSEYLEKKGGRKANLH